MPERQTPFQSLVRLTLAASYCRYLFPFTMERDYAFVSLQTLSKNFLTPWNGFKILVVFYDRFQPLF